MLAGFFLLWLFSDSTIVKSKMPEIAYAFSAIHPIKILPFSAIWKIKNLPFSAINNCNQLKRRVLRKKIKIDNFLKGATMLCRNLTLVMMQGEQRDIQMGEYTVRCMPVTDWLLKRNHIEA